MEKQRTILVVDRDPDQLRATADTLRGAGYQVFCTDTSRAALETAHKIIPDVLLVDMSLPDPHGVDICGQMRSNPSLAETKVVRVEAPVAATPDIVPGPDCAADSCLTRPVTPQLLRATVRTMVRLKRAEEQLRNSDQLWRTLFDGNPDATLLVDNGLRVVESNLKAAELFHYPADELKNVPLLQLCPEEAQSALSSRLELSLEGQAVVFQTELLRNNNAAFPAELRTRRFHIDASSYHEVIVRDLDDESDFASHSMARDHDRWTEYSWDEGNPVTAALYAGGPISQLMPTYFEELASHYANLVDLALEEKTYRIDHDLSGQLRQLSAQMGRLRAAPRDVVELHTAVLKRKMADGNLRKKQAYNVEGRFTLVELLGYLATYYRDRAIGLPENGSEQ